MFKSASGSRAPKSGKGARKIDISKITPPASPPSKTFDLSPPRSDSRGKRKEDDVEVEQIGEDVAAGAGGGGARAKGVETEVESSEATPHATIYTKRVQGSEGGCIRDSSKSGISTWVGPRLPITLLVTIFPMHLTRP
ncbi:hypothetical protein Hanom_Chr05g00418411 [Helianthus anomalus]